MLDLVTIHKKVLDQIGLKTNHFSEVLLIQIIVSKMDEKTMQMWESRSSELPKWSEFENFLINRVQTLVAIQFEKGTYERSNSTKLTKTKGKTTSFIANITIKCVFCKQQHSRNFRYWNV